MAERPPTPDPLYADAYRLARLYAILSPRILARDLRVDRARAEAILDELERQGAVGPTIIKGTGARESRVNVVEDRPTGGLSVVTSDPAAGRRVVILALAAALVGLLLIALLSWLAVGEVLNRWLAVERGSPILAAVVRSTLPSLALLGGYLIEAPLRRSEDMAPYWAVRARGWVWNAASLLAVALALLRLLS